MLLSTHPLPVWTDFPAYEVKVEGEVDLDTVSELEGRLASLIAEGWAPILVDFSRCTYIDSSGIRALLRAHRKLLKRNPESNPALALVRVTAQILRALRAGAIDPPIPIFSTNTEALEALTSGMWPLTPR
jgi:anti-anti-sigma factor